MGPMDLELVEMDNDPVFAGSGICAEWGRERVCMSDTIVM